MGGRLPGKQLRIYRATFFPAPQNRHGVKIFTVPCVNLFSVSDIYFQTRIADKDLLFLRRLLGTRQAYKWGVVHLTGVQPVKGARALNLLPTWQHIWADFCSPATHLGQILATWRHIWGQILLIGWRCICAKQLLQGQGCEKWVNLAAESKQACMQLSLLKILWLRLITRNWSVFLIKGSGKKATKHE